MFPPLSRLLRPTSLLAFAVAMAGALSASAIDLTQKTVSSSKQFIVYCPDASVRARIASAAEDTKAEVLKLLGEREGARKFPIVITLDRASGENASLPPVTYGVYGFDGGFKIGIDVRIGDDLSQINLQRYLVRALLTEYAYRYAPEALRGGGVYTEPPWWLVEGAIQITRRRDLGVDSDFFRRLIEINRLPPIEQFLTDKPATGGQTAEAIDQACAMCLVQLLIEQTDGRANLAHLLRRLPLGSQDPIAFLTSEFPTLGGAENLQRWWTLNLARFSAADRYKGLTPEETDAQLSALIQFDLPTGSDGTKRTFTIGDFDSYLKIAASRPALVHGQAAIVTLSTQASALYRPVLAEYEQIFSLLSRGKTRGIRDRLTKVERYRESVLKRTADIADYLNWFEATQSTVKTNTFDSYIRIANELEAPTRRNDPIGKYLDDISREF